MHDGEGWQRSGRRDQAAFMSRVLRSRTCTPHDAWPGGRLQRARHGLAARKTGPPPRNAQAARRPPATGGVAQASSLRHPLGGGAKRDTVAGVFSKGAPPPPPPRPRAVGALLPGGGGPSPAPPVERRPIPASDRHPGGGGGGVAEWKPPTGMQSFEVTKGLENNRVLAWRWRRACHWESTAWPASTALATAVPRVVAADGSTRDRVGSVSDLRLRGEGGWRARRGAAPRAPPTPRTSILGVMEAVEGSRRASGGRWRPLGAPPGHVGRTNLPSQPACQRGASWTGEREGKIYGCDSRSHKLGLSEVPSRRLSPSSGAPHTAVGRIDAPAGCDKKIPGPRPCWPLCVAPPSLQSRICAKEKWVHPRAEAPHLSACRMARFLDRAPRAAGTPSRRC